jgi:hypothetical protein
MILFAWQNRSNVRYTNDVLEKIQFLLHRDQIPCTLRGPVSECCVEKKKNYLS